MCAAGRHTWLNFSNCVTRPIASDTITVQAHKAFATKYGACMFGGGFALLAARAWLALPPRPIHGMV